MRYGWRSVAYPTQQGSSQSLKTRPRKTQKHIVPTRSPNLNSPSMEDGQEGHVQVTLKTELSRAQIAIWIRVSLSSCILTYQRMMGRTFPKGKSPLLVQTLCALVILNTLSRVVELYKEILHRNLFTQIFKTLIISK